jgi:ABC-type phosphate transport system permease subunit
MIHLITREKIITNVKAANRYNQLGALLNAVEAMKLPKDTTDFIDNEIEQLNAFSNEDNFFVKAIKEKENKIVKLLEKKHKIVPKKYYQTLWMVLGMSAFGVPMGVAFGLIMKNMGLLGIGFPIGMGIGVGVGAYLDKKAFNEGRQLDVDLNY